MKKKTIYVGIADSHTMFRTGVIAQLQKYKHIQFIVDAIDGQQLITELHATNQLPDVCIIDVSMYPMNGYDTANIIRDKWPSIKTIALSIIDEEYCIINMLRSGARGYITKNRTVDALLKAVEDVYCHGFHYENIDSEILSRALHGESVYQYLTDKEREFLPYCCSDLSYKEIADLMNAGQRTVESYRDSLCKKFNVKTRSGLISFALLTGLVDKKNSINKT